MEYKARDQSGVRMALLCCRFENVARKMQNTLFRTARSGVLNTAHDFSCVILTADCRLLAAAESLPIHVMIGPDLMCQAVLKYHRTLHRGDAFLHNDPYEGNSHAADHCLIAPVVDDEGILRFFVLAKAHQADCGNSQPTTYMGAARDVYEEGALIFSAYKIQQNYVDNDDIIRMCRVRFRVPEVWWGDYLAALGAVRIGERELLELGREVGWKALADYTDEWFDYSEQRMSEAIRRLPAGKITVRSAHDPFPGVPNGIPTCVHVSIDPEDARITVDLRDNPDCQPCGLNLTEACARSAALVGIYNGLMDHTVPPNAGSFRRVEVVLRENCCVGIPLHPFSCSLATGNLADRISNPVQRAIAEIAEGFGMAETGSANAPGMGVISGRDPRRDNASFVNQIFLACTGGAGTPISDGFLTMMHVATAGMCHHDSIEVDELQYPIFVVHRSLIPDTEGPGRFRGALAGHVEFGPIDGTILNVFYTADGTINPAAGACGGGPGAPCRVFKRGRDGALVDLPACGGIRLEPGETVLSFSGAGGGYGSPAERDVGQVMHDLSEGWISRARAEQIYGVVFDDSGDIDEVRTYHRRAELARRRSRSTAALAECGSEARS